MTTTVIKSTKPSPEDPTLYCGCMYCVSGWRNLPTNGGVFINKLIEKFGEMKYFKSLL